MLTNLLYSYLKNSLRRPNAVLSKCIKRVFCILFFILVLIPSSFAALNFDRNVGHVTDTSTGLVWKVCPEGQEWNGSSCIGTITKLDWAKAVQASCSKNCGTITNWRVPTIEELIQLDNNRGLNNSIYPLMSDLLWSRSEYADNLAYYFNANDFNYVFISKKNSFGLLLVSGGSSPTNTSTTTTTSSSSTTTGSSTTTTQAFSVNFSKGWNLLGNSLSQPIIIENTSVLKNSAIVSTVWKWDRSTSSWHFYAPSMSPTQLFSYVQSKGYGLLSRIDPGEGFWLNASSVASFSHSGANFILKGDDILPGWNLSSTSEVISPANLNRGLSDVPPDLSTVPINFNSLWSWNNEKNQWFFYAPSLDVVDANGTNKLSDFNKSKGYLDYSGTDSNIKRNSGFWINKTTDPNGQAFAAKLIMSFTDMNGNPITNLSSTESNKVNVTVINSSGKLVPNVVVALSGAPDIASVVPAATVITNSNGVASFTFAPANIKGTGTIIATATVDEKLVTASKTYALTTILVPTLSLELPTNNLVGNALSTVTAILKDSNGAAVPNRIVNFTNTGTAITINPSNGTALTDINGRASVTIQAANVLGAGSITAKAKVLDKELEDSKSYTVSQTVTIVEPTLLLELPNSNLVANVQSTVTATLKDATGVAVPNSIVTFTTAGTAVSMNPASGTALTDNNGRATVTIQSASVLGAGSVTAKAKVGAKELEDTKAYRVSQIATVPTMTLKLTVGSTVVSTLSNAVATTLSATVIDANSQPVEGATVTFGTSVGQMSSTTALTNAAGVATISLTPGATAGAGPVTAFTTVGSTLVNASLNYSSPAAVVPTISLTLTNGISGPVVTDISSIASTTVTATLRDAAGVVIPNAVVTFAAANFATLSATTALTDANGVARINLSSGTSTGAGVLSASSKVGATDVTSSIGYVSADATGLTLSLVDGTTPVSSVTSSTPVTAKAILKNALGQPVSGVVVTFEIQNTSMANLIPSSGTALTGADGVASVSLVAGTSAGATSIKAKGKVGVREVEQTAGFSVLPASEPASISFALTDSFGSPVSVLSNTSLTNAKATVRNASGTVIPGVVVTFSTSPDLAKITPSAATALTDSSGVATVSLSPASLSSAGATRITASVGSISRSVGFSVGAAVVTVQSPVFKNPIDNVVTSNVSAFGTVTVTANVLSNGVPVTVPQTVTFSSPCASSTPPKAFLTVSADTVAGVATASYRDNGCGAIDPITAAVSGVSSATSTLTVSPPATGSIQFVSATPKNISLKGMGGQGRQESAQLIFKVVDSAGNPLGGKTVSFGLSTEVGGITFANGLTTATATSNLTQGDSLGYAVVTVNSGNVSTPIRVSASTPGSSGAILSTLSDELSVTTGIPDQDSFSLSASTFNIEGWNFDGTETILTASLADHFNNPVPNGTAVNFTTSGGSVVSTCITTDGRCTVNLRSQDPRPYFGVGNTNNGRVRVMAYAVGEESFTDLNGNGLADKAATTPSTLNELIDLYNNSTDLGEAYLDVNANGTRDAASEPFVDFNRDGIYNIPDGAYNGVLCNENNGALPLSSSAGTCATKKSLHVFKQLTVVFSGSTAIYNNFPASINLDNGGGTSGCANDQVFSFGIADENGNFMPAGSTIAITTTNGTLTSTPTGSVINTSDRMTDNFYSFSIKGDGSLSGGVCTDSTPSGSLTITVTTPKGIVTRRSITVSN